jgi:hypothetical protein
LAARRFEQQLREVEVVLDDQDRPIAGLDVGAIVVGVVTALGRRVVDVQRRDGGLRRAHEPRLAHRRPQHAADARALHDRQEQRERAAFTRRADEPNLAAEQLRQLAADRQPKSRAAVLARRRAVGLLERLENDLLLVGGNADARIGDGERDDMLGRGKVFVVERPAARRAPDAERHGALVRELERVRQQVFDDLLHALDVREHRARHVGIEVHLERDLLGLGDMAEGALDVTLQIEQAQLADVRDDRARLDLRQIEDVVDEGQQVVARGVDRLG